jgi:hypothetical protein
MFRASSCPSSGATTTGVAASGLPSELGDSSAKTLKPEAATAVVDFLMMCVRTAETCSAVHTIKHQVINLRNCCIWLVYLFEMYDDARTCKL